MYFHTFHNLQRTKELIRWWMDYLRFYALVVIRRRRRGTIEMTLVRPSFCPSFRPSDIVPATPLTTSIGLIWNFIDCLLIISWCACGFWFYFGHFWRSNWHCCLISWPRNSCHIFYRTDLKLCWMFHHDLKICMWFWIFSFLIFHKVMALCHFWHFSNFWTVLPRKLNLVSY